MSATNAIGSALLWAVLVLIALAVLVIVLGVLVAVYRTSKGLTPAHRAFTESVLAMCADLEPGASIPVAVLEREAVALGAKVRHA